MNKFFISDCHFGHKNIIKYEDRPFASVEEMDETMIRNWNNSVGENDEVYILGDFAFCSPHRYREIIEQLNGKKYLIRGNHDKRIEYAYYEWVKDYYMLKCNNLKIALFHYPIQVWDCQHYGAIHLYGHVHSNKDDHHPMLSSIKNAYNVGADVNNFTPIELSEILEKLRLEKIMSQC